MKKFLLTLAAVMLTVAGFSQTSAKWSKSIKAHESGVRFSDWAYNSPIAAAEDGSVYVTGTFDQDLTIGSDKLDHTGTSAFLAKYSNTGEALWAISLNGAATITAISATADGAVLAGVFAEEVIIGSKDGNTQTINGMEDAFDEVSAFILRYDAAGNLKAVKTIIPEIDPFYGQYLFPVEDWDPFYLSEPVFNPQQIGMVGDRIYLSADYTADAKISEQLTLKGKVQDYYGFMYVDLFSSAILSFDTNLSDAELIYHVTSADDYTMMEPKSLKFAVSNDKVYAAGSGYGTLAVSGKQTDTIEFSMDEWEGLTENGMFIIDPEKGVKVFHATATSRSNIINEINYISVNDGFMSLVGTYSACLPFDNTKTEDSYNETFSALYNLTSETVCGVNVSGTQKGANEKEIISGVRFDDNATYVATYVYCDALGSEAIVKGVNLNFTDSGVTSEAAAEIATAMSSKTAKDVFIVTADDGIYTVSLKDLSSTAITKLIAEDNIVRKELIGGRVFLIKNGKRYNLLGIEQK